MPRELGAGSLPPTSPLSKRTANRLPDEIVVTGVEWRFRHRVRLALLSFKLVPRLENTVIKSPPERQKTQASNGDPGSR